MTAALHTELTDALKTLRMPTIKSCYEEEAEAARRESLTHERYLLEIIRRESEQRRLGRIERLLRQSRLPREKTIDTFERSRLPLKVNQQLGVLMEGCFVDRRENVLAFGNPGSGKTHLLSGIGHELVHQGRPVLVRPSTRRSLSMILATCSRAARKWRSSLRFWLIATNVGVLC